MWRLSRPGGFDPVGPVLSRKSLLLITVEGEERDWKIVQVFFFYQLSPELMCVTFVQIYISQNYYISTVNYMGLKCRLIYPEKENKKLDISE